MKLEMTPLTRPFPTLALCWLLLNQNGASAEDSSQDKIAECLALKSIGVAWMSDYGTISMRLRADDEGRIIESFLVYKPTDHDYQSILTHLGGMAPGQTKSVKPWC